MAEKKQADTRKGAFKTLHQTAERLGIPDGSVRRPRARRPSAGANCRNSLLVDQRRGHPAFH